MTPQQPHHRHRRCRRSCMTDGAPTAHSAVAPSRPSYGTNQNIINIKLARPTRTDLFWSNIARGGAEHHHQSKHKCNTATHTHTPVGMRQNCGTFPFLTSGRRLLGGSRVSCMPPAKNAADDAGSRGRGGALPPHPRGRGTRGGSSSSARSALLSNSTGPGPRDMGCKYDGISENM